MVFQSMQKFNYGKLKGRIIEKFGSQKAFAEFLGWSEGKLSKKLNNKIEFYQSEIVLFMELLDIAFDEIVLYFFTLYVQ